MSDYGKPTTNKFLGDLRTLLKLILDSTTFPVCVMVPCKENKNKMSLVSTVFN